MFMYDYDFAEFVNTVDENDVIKDTVVRYHEDYPVHEGRRAAYEVEGLFHRVMAPEATLKDFYRKDKKHFVRNAAEVEARKANCHTVYNQMMDIINTLRVEEEKYLVYSWYPEIHAVELSAEELCTRGYSKTFVQDVKALALTALMVSSSITEALVYDLIDTAQELYDTACYKPNYSFIDEYMHLAGRYLSQLHSNMHFYAAFRMLEGQYAEVDILLDVLVACHTQKALRYKFFHTVHALGGVRGVEEFELGDDVCLYNIKCAFLEMLTR